MALQIEDTYKGITVTYLKILVSKANHITEKTAIHCGLYLSEQSFIDDDQSYFTVIVVEADGKCLTEEQMEEVVMMSKYPLASVIAVEE